MYDRSHFFIFLGRVQGSKGSCVGHNKHGRWWQHWPDRLHGTSRLPQATLWLACCQGNQNSVCHIGSTHQCTTCELSLVLASLSFSWSKSLPPSTHTHTHTHLILVLCSIEKLIALSHMLIYIHIQGGDRCFVSSLRLHVIHMMYVDL